MVIQHSDLLELQRKVRILRQPGTYPDSPVSVVAIQTHMSWVFLTRDFAWKLKKPVRYPFLDFSTLEARRLDAESEVILNRRLAPKVYLGVVPLKQRDGEIHLGGDGDVIDWLVKMFRLPRHRMLEQVIRERAVETTDLMLVANLLAHFYVTSEPVAMTPGQYRQSLLDCVRDNERELSDSSLGLPAALVRMVAKGMHRFLDERSELFDERVRAGRIIEAHGDLRPEHIYIGDDPAVIDCLEFCRDFRILDIASELAFLSVECGRLGAAWVGDVFVDVYHLRSGDAIPEPVFNFYKSFHAFLRGKIAIWHMREPDHEASYWRNKTTHYLALADEFISAAVHDG